MQKAGSPLLRRLQRDLLFVPLCFARWLFGVRALVNGVLTSTLETEMVESASLVPATFPTVIEGITVVVLSLLKLLTLPFLTLAFAFALRLLHSLSLSFSMVSLQLLSTVIEGKRPAIGGGHGEWCCKEAFLRDRVSVGVLKRLLESATVEHVVVGLLSNGIFVGQELIPRG